MRMMPECRHYFHAPCLDAWLKLNGSCPVCRNSPLPTPLSTPLSKVVPLSQYAADRRSRRMNCLLERLLLILDKIKMAKEYGLAKMGTWKSVHRIIFILGACVVLVSVSTLSRSYSIISILVTDFFCNVNPSNPSRNGGGVSANFEVVIQKIRQEMDELRKGMSKESSSSEILLKHGRFLADILGLIELMQEPVRENENTTVNHPLLKPIHQSDGPADYFFIEEIRKYVQLEEYMDFDVGEICNDDWKLAQKLMVHGCDPLPRRLCLVRAPRLYTQTFPINKSIWKLPDDRNVRWSGYRCKNFTCLASNATRKGFFKCADCFNLLQREMPRWIQTQPSTSGQVQRDDSSLRIGPSLFDSKPAASVLRQHPGFDTHDEVSGWLDRFGAFGLHVV
ncbi:putative RING-H2 finger protein ATL69 [Hibiscus syriacus]|uniref:RING-H2 finger protein ATL69 n=1 Tax=Hibiscus syriacus TaxID=106335 RepID=A0A6A3BJS1_HIBSY|nr:putative RING-H2 finger protein ATL69 [Hibiscus syriacus]